MEGDFCVQQSTRASSAVPMDQVLEQSYNKTAKGKGSVIGITTQKATIAKWNLIKHEKMQYIKVLYDFCGLLIDDEYSLHHDFSDAVTVQDIKLVENIITFVEQRSNPFKKDSYCNVIKNIATGTVINQNSKAILISCTKSGQAVYEKFIDERFSGKSKKLFDVIPKLKTIGRKDTLIKPLNVQKQHVKALKYIDYARLRLYEIRKLLKYELAPVSLCLTKGNKVIKPDKHELTNLLEVKLEVSSLKYVPVDDKKMAVFFDFMAYARKVATNKLKTLGDFVASLWKTISFLSKDAQRIDIVFDLYLENKVKYGERNRCQKTTAIDVIIKKDNQPLPVTMDSFWASSANKENLQMFFINWLLKFYKDDRPVYLGGSVPGDITGCIQIIGGISGNCLDLKCDREEADEQILYHINHAIQYESYTKVVLAATDTDIFISLLYHYQQWVYEDLQEIRMLYDQGAQVELCLFPKLQKLWKVM